MAKVAQFGATLGLMLLVSWPAVAASPLDGFFGRWAGSAITQAIPSAGFDVFRNRDLDVEIKTLSDGGFSIDWTTVIRDRRTGEVRRRNQSIAFTPTDKPNLWRGSESGDLIDGGGYSWARLDGETLIVYVVAVGEEGGLHAAIYYRQLLRERMSLQFRRIVDGRETLFVHGTLRRAE